VVFDDFLNRNRNRDRYRNWRCRPFESNPDTDPDTDTDADADSDADSDLNKLVTTPWIAVKKPGMPSLTRKGTFLRVHQY